MGKSPARLRKWVGVVWPAAGALGRPRPERQAAPVCRGSAPDLKGAAAGSRSWHHGLHAERRGQGGGGAE